jgi:glycosyltransferase involved in cell wall biosynthesis
VIGATDFSMEKFIPLVSVVIPTHNRAHLLGRAVRSVLRQTFLDFELIVVDDASADDTTSIINGFPDKRIKYIRHGSNLGGPAARNTGITNARGDYIGLLDDDDEWFPEKLEKQVLKFSQVPETVGLIYCGYEVRESDNRLLRTYLPDARGDVHLRLLLGTTIGSPTPLIRKACFQKAGLFDESLKSCQDWDMWKRISDRYEFDYVPEVLAIGYRHEKQISSDFTSMIPGRTRMVEKHLAEFSRHPEILVIHLKRLGKMHCINGTWREAIHWFYEALKVNPFEIFKIAAWCILELPKIKLSSREAKFRKYLQE